MLLTHVTQDHQVNLLKRYGLRLTPTELQFSDITFPNAFYPNPSGRELHLFSAFEQLSWSAALVQPLWSALEEWAFSENREGLPQNAIWSTLDATLRCYQFLQKHSFPVHFMTGWIGIAGAFFPHAWLYIDGHLVDITFGPVHQWAIEQIAEQFPSWITTKPDSTTSSALAISLFEQLLTQQPANTFFSFGKAQPFFLYWGDFHSPDEAKSFWQTFYAGHQHHPSLQVGGVRDAFQLLFERILP